MQYTATMFKKTIRQSKLILDAVHTFQNFENTIEIVTLFALSYTKQRSEDFVRRSYTDLSSKVVLFNRCRCASEKKQENIYLATNTRLALLQLVDQSTIGVWRRHWLMQDSLWLL